MTIEAQLEQNNGLLSRIIALLEQGSQPIVGATAASQTNPTAATPKPRGRPVKGEAAAQVAATASQAVAEADPFDSPAPAASAQPTVTEEEVRAALNALKEAVSQAKALEVLNTAGGATNLSDLRKTPEKFALVVAAAKAALPTATVNAVEADPFETASEPVKQPDAKPLTVEDVKAACVAAGKRTGQDKVQKLVMEHGGKAKNAATGVEGPSLNALPATAYAALIAAVAALPTTK